MKKIYIVLIILGILIVFAVIGLNIYKDIQIYKHDFVYVIYGFKGMSHPNYVNSLEELSNLYDEHPEYTYQVYGKYSDKSCNCNNNLTKCGKEFYCPTHIPKENCLKYNCTWELESPLNNYNLGIY